MKGRSVKKRPSPPGDLAPRLRRAPSRELLALVGRHLRDFTMREVRQVLLNPHVSGEVIEELLVARHLRSSYEVRRAIARHQRTPEAAAMRFISGLFWHDLAEIALDVRLKPAVRRVAERYLIQRLPRLTVGEKVTLARRATGEVIACLRRDPSRRVIRALLENPRLTVQLIVPLAAKSGSPRILDLVAKNTPWGQRYEVRSALAENHATPFRAVFAILPTLRREDLARIAGDDEHSSVVRNRAREILEERPSHASGSFDRPEGGEIDWIEIQ